MRALEASKPQFDIPAASFRGGEVERAFQEVKDFLFVHGRAEHDAGLQLDRLRHAVSQDSRLTSLREGEQISGHGSGFTIDVDRKGRRRLGFELSGFAVEPGTPRIGAMDCRRGHR